MSSEAERVTAFVKRHPNCPVCGSRDLQTTNPDGGPMETRIMSGPVLGSSLSTYAVICNNCGSLRLIAQGSVP